MFDYFLRISCFLFFSFSVSAFDYSHLEVEYFHISQWQIKNPIGKTVIGDVAYDEFDNLILATSDGIKTFDGLNFSEYYPYNSAPNNTAFGRIYFNDGRCLAVNYEGLFLLEESQFTHYDFPLSYNTYSSFSSLNNKEVWFISDFKLFSIALSEAQSNRINDYKSTAIHISNNPSRIFQGSQGVVYELDSSGKLINKITLADKELVVTSLYLTKSENLLISTNKGVFVYDTLQDKMSDEVIPVVARMVLESSNGQIWFGTSLGIFVYDNNTLKRINLPKDKDLRVRGIIEDKYGNIWFGTWGEGLFRLKRTSLKFLSTDVNPDSYYEMTNHDKWIGGYKGLVILHDNIKIVPSVEGVENVAVYDIAEGLNNSVWVAYKSNLVHYNVLGENPRINTDINALFYKFLQKDSENNLWVGTEKGLYYKKLARGDPFKKLELPNNENINTVVLLKGRKILILTDQNSYIYIDGIFSQNPLTNRLITSNLVLTYDENNDVIWFYNKQKNHLIKSSADASKSFVLDKILARFSFYSIEKTINNDIVLLGENGIVRIREEWLQNYSETHPLFFETLAIPGLNKNECNGGHRSLTTDSQGKVYFTCKTGILSLVKDAKQLVSQSRHIKMALEVDDEAIDVEGKEIKISPQAQSYQFSFQSESLNELVPLKYRYKLTGIDKNWHYVNANNNSTIVYANLKPNSYVFQAQVQDSHSLWASTNKKINFTVTRYFYQKYWFILLIGCFLILLYFINDHLRSWRFKKETTKLSKLVDEKTESLRVIQKRELKREQESRNILNKEIEKKSNELEQHMSLMLEKEKQLQETQKMEVVGQLTSGIAHDFNNMLSIIFIGSEVVKKDLEKNKEEQYKNIKWLNNILLTAENCREVIGQLLKFTRKDNDKNQVFCIYDALSDILSLLKIGIPKEIEFNLNFSTEATFINADLSQFNQVILNLIINARKACGDYGEITITTEVVDGYTSESCVSCQQLIVGKYMEIVVSDTGKGIPVDLLEHVFKPFFSADSGNHSTGIGLHIVNSNVHRMGGHIQAFANPIKGMTFKVLLPLVANNLFKAPEMLTVVAPKNELKNVLLVEDSASLVELISLIFDESNISYDVGKNGLEGIDLFYQNPIKYDLVLTDNSMPEMNGIDMSTRILSDYPKTNVVLLTGDVTDAVIKVCDTIGIHEIFLKPIKSDELIKLVRSYTKHVN